MAKLSWCALCLLFFQPIDADTKTFRLDAYPLAGAWESDDSRYHLTYWADKPYLIRAADGKAWTLTHSDPDESTYELTGLDGTPTGVTLRLPDEDRWVVTPTGSPIESASRVRYPARPIVVRNGDVAELHGTIIEPIDGRPKAMIIYLNGEGPNPRTDLLPHALALLESGYGAVVFDQRHAGASTGAENSGSYHERSLRAAADATEVTRRITGDARYRYTPVGVVGWSQGGWIGAIVTRENPELDFYINVAGNAAPGWRQWRHSMICRLIRAGVAESDLAHAQAYFDSFFGVMWGTVSWEDYLAARTHAVEEAWWPVMKRRNVAEWESESEALEFRRREESHDPREDFHAVTVPTLGIFFEFDGSSTPDSPGIFAAALAESDASSFSVVQLPGLQHGSWVVDGYADRASRLSTRSPAVAGILSEWLDRTVDARSTRPRSRYVR